jgi:hypothetical protein
MARLLDYGVTICDPRILRRPCPPARVTYARRSPDDAVLVLANQRTPSLPYDPRLDDLALVGP